LRAIRNALPPRDPPRVPVALLPPLLQNPDRERGQGANGLPPSWVGEDGMMTSAENGKPEAH
jgi:hypothetical protein